MVLYVPSLKVITLKLNMQELLLLTMMKYQGPDLSSHLKTKNMDTIVKSFQTLGNKQHNL